MLTNGRDDYLSATLAALYRQTLPPFAILVVDNGSSARFPDHFKMRFPNLHVLKGTGQKGISSGRHICVSYFLQSPCEWLLILDDDIELAPDCLKLLHTALESDPSLGAAAPVMLHDNDHVLSAGGTYSRSWGQPFLSKKNPETHSRLDFTTGAIGLYRKEAVAKAGNFDLDFEPYGFEDVDYGLRMNDAGFSIQLDPQAKCRHLSRYSFHQESPFRLHITLKHRIYCAFKHCGRFRFIFLFLPWCLFRRVAVPGVRFLLGGRPGLISSLLRGVMEGLCAAFARASANRHAGSV